MLNRCTIVEHLIISLVHEWKSVITHYIGR